MKKDDIKTQFHGGFQFLERVDNILKGLDIVTVSREVTEDKQLLMCWRQNYSLIISLYKELYPKMNDNEKFKHEEIRKFVNQHYNKSIHEFKTQKRTNTEFLNWLDQWELELRQLAENKGLLMPDRESDLSATEED